MLSEPAEQGLRVLVVDDEEVIHKSVGHFLELQGYTVLCARSGEEGLRLFGEEGADIVLTDIRMPGMDGIELLEELGRRSRDTEVILITGHGDMDTTIEALRKGAFDFLRKPIKLDELLACLRRTRRYREVVSEKDRIQRQLEALRRMGALSGEDGKIIGESPAIRQALELVDKVARTGRTTVLVEGESGTGKELVARTLHARSPRAAMPFVGVNCAAIPESLLEDELFGHERGAFTDARTTRKGLFELADGGVLFLDEIGDMSLPAQARLLRVLEQRTVRRVGGNQEIAVDVWLIAATHQDLQALVDQGRFRQDIYFRLNVFKVSLPPLRERGDDTLLLAYYFLYQYASEFGKRIEQITPDAQHLLRHYRFPGNIRELRNLIERAVILCEGDRLSGTDFPDLARGEAESEDALETNRSLNLDELEGWAIRAALKRAGGNRTEAARYLGIGYDALRYRLKKHGLEQEVL